MAGWPRLAFRPFIQARSPFLHCTTAVAAVELPCAFVKTTVTDATAFVPPVSVNGCVYRNALPKAADALFAYHAENTLLTGTVSEVVSRFAPAAGVKVKTACVMLREVV